MRTVEEIIAKIKSSDSLLGFESEVWVDFLTFEQAKPLLKPEAREDKWGVTLLLTREAVIEAMREYAARIGWDKIENHRGISASRTVEKMRAWLWLLGDEDVLVEFDALPYPQYGAPVLRWVCERFGFPWPKDKKAIVRMTEGEPCCDDCEEGCGLQHPREELTDAVLP